VARLAEGVIALDEQLQEVDALIEERFRRHPSTTVITSLPGVGTLLGAEFLAATGGDMTAFESSDRLASLAGVAPVPRDSGRVAGNLHRPRRYNRAPQRVFYTRCSYLMRGPWARVGTDGFPGVWLWLVGVFVRSFSLLLTGAGFLRAGGRVQGRPLGRSRSDA
jgi:hypothetical protein